MLADNLQPLLQHNVLRRGGCQKLASHPRHLQHRRADPSASYLSAQRSF
jgi:hypothetical protein